MRTTTNNTNDIFRQKDILRVFCNFWHKWLRPQKVCNGKFFFDFEIFVLKYVSKGLWGSDRTTHSFKILGDIPPIPLMSTHIRLEWDFGHPGLGA